MERHTMKLDGERYDTVYLLRVIADQLEQSYTDLVPPPTPEGSNPIPSRFSILWRIARDGVWLGYLVEYWEHECKAYNRTRIFNTPILRIEVTSDGGFQAKCMLARHHTLVTSSTLKDCKQQTEKKALGIYLLDDLYSLCVKEDCNNVKEEWWK